MEQQEKPILNIRIVKRKGSKLKVIEVDYGNGWEEVQTVEL
jgi:hypothetical protein